MIIKIQFEIDLAEKIKYSDSSLLKGRDEQEVLEELQELFGYDLSRMNDDAKELYSDNFDEIFNY